MKSRILSIEDDVTIQVLIEQSLKEFLVVSVSTLKQAQDEILKSEFDALLIDIELPDGDGLRFYTKISQDQKYKKIPAIFLTGQIDVSTKLMAFSMGADDYVTKPFDPLELNARVTSKIKKNEKLIDEKKVRKIGDLEIDFDRQKCFQIKNGKEVDLSLTAIELKILTFVSKRLEQVYSREQILSEVWGDTNITDRTVDSHIAHLRAKTETSKVVIDTVKNFGYRVIVKI